MAIDDNTSYELTGAQVKDLAARIKAGGGGGMTVYVDASFATPSSITGVFSDSALTTPADPDAMAGIISAGSTVLAVYDGGQSEEIIELSSVNSNSRFPEVGQAFTSVISTNAIFSAPTLVILLYDGTLDSWSVETASVPTKTSDLTNDGDDGVHPFLATDDVATVATTGAYSDLTGTPTIPAAQIQSDWTQTTTTALDYIKNKPEIRHVSAVSDAGWSADENKLVDGSVLAYWNGAYSGTTSNLQYFKNNSIGCNHFNEWSTANTADTWVPVGNGNKIQHRVIKAFNSDGSIPASAIADSAVTTAKINNAAVTSAKIDWGNCRSYGSGSYNTSYFNGGRIQYVKYGNMVTVTVSDLSLKAAPPNSTNQTTAITGLPQSASWMQNCTFNFTIYGGTTKPLTLRMDASKTAFYFHYTSGTGSSGTFNGQFTYPAA